MDHISGLNGIKITICSTLWMEYRIFGFLNQEYMPSNPETLGKYLYELPEEKIAKHPLANRDDARLLFYHSGQISHRSFRDVVGLVPKDALIFLNNTKVIAARLYFQKPAGAQIEVLLTEPTLPHTGFQKALKTKNKCTWKCMIGNLKKWKDENVLSLKLNEKIRIKARLVDRDQKLVEFSWHGDQEFLEVIEAAGNVPLPPYLNRAEEAGDKTKTKPSFPNRKAPWQPLRPAFILPKGFWPTSRPKAYAKAG